MSWKGTVVLLLMAGCALAFFLFSGGSRTHPPQEPLLALNPEQATTIRIQQGGVMLRIVKSEGIWFIQPEVRDKAPAALPPRDRANPALVNALLHEAADIVPLDILRSEDLKGNLNLGSLGLKKPDRSITLEAGKKQTLWFGTSGAAPQTLYARLDSGKTVYLISSKITSTAFRPLQEYRDPRVTAIDPDHLDEVVFNKGSTLQQIHLKREIGTQHGWMLESPVATKGDDQAVDTWLHSLLSAQIINWLPEGTAPSMCGLDTPSATVTLHEEGASAPITLTIGSPSPDTPDSNFVRCSDRPGICLVSNGISTLLAGTPESLRSKSINQVDLDTIDRIEIKDDTNSLTLSRKQGGHDWLKNSMEIIPADQVEQWYAQLQGLRALRFDAATPEHLDQWGYGTTNSPQNDQNISIKLIAQLSENTAQENAGETLLANYRFGSATNGEVSLLQSESSDLLILPESATRFLHAFSAPIPDSKTDSPTPSATP
jgi:hypothetical protein